MDAIFNKYERLPRWLQFIVVIFVDIGIYCVLSILSYALYAKAIFHLERYVTSYWIMRAHDLLQGVGMSIVAVLLFRLIVLTYFEENGISKLEVTLTAVYSQFGIYAFFYFMRNLLFYRFYGKIDELKYLILHEDINSPTPYGGWLLFENVFDIVSITILVILILQILYLQHSQNNNTHSLIYWKVVIFLAIVFCFVYMLVISVPPLLIPIMGSGPENDPVVYITAITGLVSAVSALYSQILAGKKMKLEMEQFAAQKASLAPAKVSKNKAVGKSTKQRKSKQPS